MSKHIVIGLGGTGLTMVRALRCIISEELEVKEQNINGRLVTSYYSPASNTPRDVDIRYLEVDSNAVDLIADFKGCNPTTGPSLKLGDSYQLNIKAGTTNGANQRRDEGVQLFCAHAAAFDRKINRLLTELNDDPNIEFHICAGLAGGTGSGSIVDVVCRLRQLCKHNGGTPSRNKIHLYVYLPHSHVDYAQVQYEPNGYAALAELSSLNTRQWTPMDKNPALPAPVPYSFDAAAPNDGNILQPVFDNCYIFTQTNAGGHSHNIGNAADPMGDGIGQLFGYFFFEKCFVWDRASDDNARALLRNLKQADSSENLGFHQFEYSYDLGADAATANGPVSGKQGYAIHSNRFQTVGFKRLVVPVLEMKRHYAAVLANEALLQLRYNLANTAGYLDPQAGLNDKGLLAYQATLGALTNSEEQKIRNKPSVWNLEENGFITAQKAILGEQVEEIHSHWEETCYEVMKEVKKHPEKDTSWLVDFENYVNEYFEDSYYEVPGQSFGVNDCYLYHEQQIDTRAGEHVRQWVQKMLGDLFQTSAKPEPISLRQMNIQATALRNYISGDPAIQVDTAANGSAANIATAIANYEKKIESLGDDEQGTIEALVEAKNEIKAKYNNLNFISRRLNRVQYLQDFSDAMHELLVAKTKKHAYAYAVRYLNALADKLNQLITDTSTILSVFDKTLRGTNAEDGSSLKDGIQSLMHNCCPGGYNVDHSLQTDVSVKFYDTARMHANDETLRSDRNLIPIYLDAIREAVYQKILDGKQAHELQLQHVLDYFNNTEDFMKTLMQTSLDIINEHERFTFLKDFNINREINRLYPGAAQGNLGATIFAASDFSAETDAGEINAAKAANDPINTHHHTNTAVLIAQRDAGNVATLTNNLAMNLGAGSIAMIDSETQLLVTRVENGLPPRAFSRVRELYNNYQTLRRDRPNIGLHTDGSNEPFPQYFPVAEDIKTMYRGSCKERLGDTTDLTDGEMGSLFKRYLLGWVYPTTDAVTNTTYWCTPDPQQTDVDDTNFIPLEEVMERPARQMVLKRQEHFPIDDYERAIRNSVGLATGAMQAGNGLSPISMSKLFLEMKETQHEWEKITKPDGGVDEEVMDQRRAAMQRLRTAVDAIRTRHNNQGSWQYRHASTLLRYYSQELGM